MKDLERADDLFGAFGAVLVVLHAVVGDLEDAEILGDDLVAVVA